MTATGIDDDKFLWEVHHYTNEYIRFADTKAAFVAGTATALVGVLVSSSALDSCFRSPPWDWPWMLRIAALSLALLVASLLFSVVAIRPRLWNKVHVGHIFWDSIAGHGKAAAFSKAMLSRPASERTTELAEHLYVLATIAKRKYSHVKWAIHTGVAGGVLAGIVLFLQHALKK